MESAFKSLYDTRHRSFDLSFILGMPDVMSDELFDGFLPLVLEKLLITDDLEHFHQSVDILYENVVTSNENLLLLLLGA